MAVYSIASDTARERALGVNAGQAVKMIPADRVQWLVAAIVLGFSALLIFLAIDGLTVPMRLTIAVFVATIVAWTILGLPETPVALGGAVALAAVGAIPEEGLYRSLGNDIVWLMLSAFLIAAVLRHAGVVEHIIVRLTNRLSSVNGLFWSLTAAISSTAFIIPSTSARAAILMPVYAGLTAAIGNARVSRALALLFPSVILLSAGASLVGAGAHLVAVDFIGKSGAASPDFLGWAALAAPFSLICGLLACGVLLRFFLTPEERRLALHHTDAQDRVQTPLSNRQRLVLAVVGIAVLLFATQSLHGIGMPIVGLVAALVLTQQRISGLSLKTALKSVEWNLLLFLAGTLVIGEALIETGTAQLLAERMVGLFCDHLSKWTAAVIAFAAIVATFSHLVITSRTARATVLIPAFSLPLAALGVNPVSLIMVVTLASGFCQTLLVSAKPVALFGAMEPPAFNQADLLRLAGFLILPFILLLVAFATFVWPLQGVSP